MNKYDIFTVPSDEELDPDEHIPAELLEENLRALAEKSHQDIIKFTENDGYFNDGISAELVFRIVKTLKLPTEVGYVAVGILDKFMKEHISELYGTVKSSSSQEKQLDWSSVEERLKDQLHLRAVSCIQVASKLVSHYDALTPSKVKRHLQSHGLQYSIASVVKSESRILRTLDFRLNFTSPLTYIEVLLEVLRRNCPGLEVKLIYDVSCKILDIFFLQKIYICEKLCDAAGVQFDIKRASDSFLIAVCVVVSAAYVIDSKCSDLFIEQIVLITCVDEADIVMFSSMLVKAALNV